MIKIGKIFSDPLERRIALNQLKNILITLVKILILIGVGYVIVSPIIGMVVSSIASTEDIYNPMMYVLPRNPGTDKYELVLLRLDYFKTIGRDLLYTCSLTVIQLFICSMVGYGFARFNFKFKNILFACVKSSKNRN